MYLFSMKLKAQNDIIVCSLASSNEKTTSTGFVYKSNDIPLYKVEDVGPSVKMELSVGDLVVVNATGTLASIDGIDYKLFKEENIMGKVE